MIDGVVFSSCKVLGGCGGDCQENRSLQTPAKLGHASTVCEFSGKIKHMGIKLLATSSHSSVYFIFD